MGSVFVKHAVERILGAAREITARTRHRARLTNQFPGVWIAATASVGNIGGIEIGEGSSISDFAVVNTSYMGTEPAWRRSIDGRIRLGGNVSIRRGAILSCSGGGYITIHDNVQVNPYCVLYGFAGLDIGANTLIASHTVIVPANHVYASRETLIAHQHVRGEGIRIGEDVWIGAHCSILDGVEIGKGAVIGAGSVVTRDIPEYAIAAGCPARTLDIRGQRKEVES